MSIKIVRTPLNGSDPLVLNNDLASLDAAAQYIKDHYHDPETLCIVDGDTTYDSNGSIVRVNNVGVEDSVLPCYLFIQKASKKFFWRYMPPGGVISVRSHEFTSPANCKQNIWSVKQVIIGARGSIQYKGIMGHLLSTNGKELLQVPEAYIPTFKQYLLDRSGYNLRAKYNTFESQITPRPDR